MLTFCYLQQKLFRKCQKCCMLVSAASESWTWRDCSSGPQKVRELVGSPVAVAGRAGTSPWENLGLGSPGRKLVPTELCSLLSGVTPPTCTCSISLNPLLLTSLVQPFIRVFGGHQPCLEAPVILLLATWEVTASKRKRQL